MRLADRPRREQPESAGSAHATVDQAIGALIARGGLSPQEAWDVLREVSMTRSPRRRRPTAVSRSPPDGTGSGRRAHCRTHRGA
ncbi:ANTAR domain-containing protein [Streptomyces sp. NRRL B-1347]|uniref:ANTAR domain-containing protein n=1 Tax=Streptomyces sp. NRRL B-1347 TaxID=1476877 RepID=UPI00099B42E5|nr:ANTAR domain-containing protein [Streptomyces sp. NRRL B-1347]